MVLVQAAGGTPPGLACGGAGPSGLGGPGPFHVQEVEVLNEVGLEVLQKKARFLT